MENARRIHDAGLIAFPASLNLDDRCGHVALFYREEEFLLDELCQFLGDPLCSGAPAIMIGTQEHRDGLADRLYRRGLDVNELIQSGSYVEVDAAEALGEFLLDGVPDPGRFRALVDTLLARTRNAAKQDGPVAAFDEMSALLWAQGRENPAVRLEELWNDLADAQPISLCCGYSLDSFPEMKDGEPFHRICSRHTAVVPGEGYSRRFDLDERLRIVAGLQQRSLALETEAKLRCSEGRYRKLVEAIQDYAIYTLDTHGYLTTWNAGATRILGYQEPEILGRHFSCFFTEGEILAGEPMRELKRAGAEGRFEGQGWRLRKDGRKFPANVVLTPVRNDAGAVIAFAGVTRDMTERVLARDSIGEARDGFQESEEPLRQFSFLVMRRQEEERRRVDGELLDSLGQYLSVLKMKLDCMRPVAENFGSEGDEELAQSLYLVEESIREVREVSYLLYPPLLEEVGLRSAIPWYLDGFTKRTGIRTTFQISPGLRRLSNDESVAIFRVLQEALTNLHRHSGSSTADIELLARNDRITLIVRDAGRGIPSELLSRAQGQPASLGMGLREMSERMRYLGGKLEIASSGNGATVTATIPFADCAAAAMSA